MKVPLLSPYAEFMGLRLDGAVVVMPFRPMLTGVPGILHGDVITALLEIAAGIAAQGLIPAGAMVKPISTTTDFYRAGMAEATYAEARILKAGRRILNLGAECWQQDRSKPIAAARVNFLVLAPEVPAGEQQQETPAGP